MSIHFSFQLHSTNEASTPYGELSTKSPMEESLLLSDFRDGVHFRTEAESGTNHLILSLEDRILSVVVDQSGSMTWNDSNGDRFVLLKRLLSKLESTYPGQISGNLLTFGGSLIKTTLFLTNASSLSTKNVNFQSLLKETFENSVFDFSGVRVVRRKDTFPEHPGDGIIVGEGIFESIKDDDLEENETYYYGIFTFNKNNSFSRGKFIRATTGDRVLPQGVNYVSALPKVSQGPERDEYTQIIYNFTEGYGQFIFDSSGNGRHGYLIGDTIESNFWTGDSSSSTYVNFDLKKPVGVKFDGEFDVIESTVDSTVSYIQNLQSLTVSFWMFRYTTSSVQWIIGTSETEPSTNIGWAIGIQPDGYVCFEGNTIPGASPFNNYDVSHLVPEKEWTMVTAVFDSDTESVKVYINGINIGPTIDFSFVSDTSSYDKLYIGGKSVNIDDYFGALNHISIHNTIRSDDYINDLYNHELTIVEQSQIENSQIEIDNTQREVLLYWNISSGFDFDGGQIKIVRKYNSVPSHDLDGDIVSTVDADEGDFYYLDTHNFIHNSNYYYRFFTYNSIGLSCDRNEAKILHVHIPRSENVNGLSAPTSNEVIIPGNKKLRLQWQNPESDLNWAGTRIYYNTQEYPIISFSSNGTYEASNGKLLTDTTENFFNHRSIGKNKVSGSDTPLCNGTTYYYTIVTYDYYNNISTPRFIQETPSEELSTVFITNDVENEHAIIINPQTISIKWENPTIRSDQIDLYFGDNALCYINIQDVFGSQIENINNIKLDICTLIEQRSTETTELPLGNSLESKEFCIHSTDAITENFGSNFPTNCSNDEILLTSSMVDSGLIKGIISTTSNRQILSRRQKYTIDVRAQYEIKDTNNNTEFELSTKGARITFRHPLKISIINLKNKTITLSKKNENSLVGKTICGCDPENDTSNSSTVTLNGGYINATDSYTARIEVQYKGESLPDGYPISLQVFKQSSENRLSIKPNRVVITEGQYNTISIEENETDEFGNETGNTISKSYVDIDIEHPSLPESIDLYVTLDFLGFVIDAVHSIHFAANLIIKTDVAKPYPDGIDVAEQFATAWLVNPDFPNDETRRTPVPDNTIIKWELIRYEHSKPRPFYSTEVFPQILSGVYSRTTSGVARNVFFGPVGNIENHVVIKKCGEDDPGEVCCTGEDYAIKASIIFDDISSSDGKIISYECSETDSFSNKRFLLNAAPDQTGQNPHWITWADGTSLLKFQIAKNPAISDMLGADCFRRCTDLINPDQSFEIPAGSIVQISSPGEIIWNAEFETDPYTGEQILVSYNSVKPEIGNTSGIQRTANIPITGETTDFYIRYNAFIGDGNNPRPQECESGQSTFGQGSGGDVILPCEWEGLCNEISGICAPTKGQKWLNTKPIKGQTTLISNNKSIVLVGGGGYEDGIPPVFVGFKEPLDMYVLEARVNNIRVQELVVDSFSKHTFIVETTFSGKPVPDGTPIEIEVTGENTDVVFISNCDSSNIDCHPSKSGTIYTRQINDPFINPSGAKRSFAFFTLEPLPNIAFNAKIKFKCRYDKVGTVERLIERCVEINNTINIQSPEDQNLVDSSTDSVTEDRSLNLPVSNELIVYDTLLDTYESLSGMQISRIGHFSGHSSVGSITDKIFVFSGRTGGESSTNSITNTSEVYDISEDSWNYISDIPTARVGGMSVTINNSIYCIGGLELDPIINQLIVSRKIEKYNIDNDTWDEFLSPMPINLGVAFGVCHEYDNYIYVLCGINKIKNNTQPDVLNTKILKYSIDLDEWEEIEPTDYLSYQRIYPFSIIRDNEIIVYGGSLPKTPQQIEAERTKEVNKKLDELRSEVLTSEYFKNLTVEEQDSFIAEENQKIQNSVQISPFFYPPTGFKLTPDSEYSLSGTDYLDVTDSLDDEWRKTPQPRDKGQSVYINSQDIIYFIGGSNQNQSTTINKVESITFDGSDVIYDTLNPLSRGRSLFQATNIGHEIYITGGLTSGHKNGFSIIETQQYPNKIEANGTQNSGILITVRNDSGEIINRDIRISVHGKLKIPAIDDALSAILAEKIVENQGSTVPIINPNSDKFQFNSAKKLKEELLLFPVIYDQSEFLLRNGVGSITLKARSEDPLSDIQKLAEFINSILINTPEEVDPNEDLNREQLAAIGDILSTIVLPPVTINSGSLRNLYRIETIITIIDDEIFGQTVSEFDLLLQEQIEERIESIQEEDEDEDEETEVTETSGIGLDGGSAVTKSKCFLLQHLADNSIGSSDNPLVDFQSPNRNPYGTNTENESGQCLSCSSLIPMNATIKQQSLSNSVQFYNKTDWIPQINKIFTSNNTTIGDILEHIDLIDRETPFGSSQLYDAIIESSYAMNDLEDRPKSIYVCSDNSENLSINDRNFCIEEVNNIDGEKKCPIIYTLISTSFPRNISSQLEQIDVGDVSKLTTETGGQPCLLLESRFMDEVLNLVIGSSVGGLGYGVYTKTISFDDLNYITQMNTSFILPSNTQGSIRIRHSEDGYNFSDWTARYYGSQSINFIDFFAKKIEAEITLSTGFSYNTSEEYDEIPTGTPKLHSIEFIKSGKQEEYIYLSREDGTYSATQIAAAIEANLPKNSSVKLGATTSNSHHWEDFESDAQPSVEEFGKIMILDRTELNSDTAEEILETEDYLRYKTKYGKWSPNSTIKIVGIDENQEETEILSGFKPIPRTGEIYFDTKQNPNKKFKIYISNESTVKIGLKITNRSHDESVLIYGVGYIYSTDKQKSSELSQVAPRVINVKISPIDPASNDTLFAVYDYFDINNNKESGTLISWYRNGEQLLEIQNRISWSNDDLLANHKLQPNDRIYYSITPSDGIDYGSSVFSTAVTIVPQEPIIENLRLIPIVNGNINSRYDTSSTIQLQYVFNTNDSGQSALERGSEINWFVNGVLFKEGIFDALNIDPYNDPKSIFPGETSTITALTIGNQIYAEVTPRTSLITGPKTRSKTITIENTIPRVSNLLISPTSPTRLSTLQLSFNINDIDIFNGLQTDQREIKWFKSTDGISFSEVSELENQKTVTPFYMNSSEIWYAEVTPYDGLDIGETTRSNSVIIS